jgi:hypothetical protein
MPMSATIFGRAGVPVTRLVDLYWTDYTMIPNEYACSAVLIGGPMVVDLPLSDVMVTLGHSHYVNGEDVPCEWLKHCPSYCNHPTAGNVVECIQFIEEVV